MATIAEQWVEQGRTEGLKKGRTEGLKKGRTEGMKKGREEGREAALILLRRWLNYRLQIPLAQFDEDFQTLDLATITHLSEVAFEVESLTAFEARLVEIQPDPDDQDATE